MIKNLSAVHYQAPSDLAALAPSFGAAHLFIDDCPDLTTCYRGWATMGPLPGAPIGQCWSWGDWTCAPDHSPCNRQSIDSLGALCNSTYPECEGVCSPVVDPSI